MSFLKKGFAAVLFLATVGLAQQNTEIGNVCDTLTLSKQPLVTLVPSYIEEFGWIGKKDLSAKDSSWNLQHDDYTTLVPLHNNMQGDLPLSIVAGCSENYDQPSTYATWSKASKKWYYEDGNSNFSTYIMDSRMADFGAYNEKNSYNFLAWVRNGDLSGSYHAGEIMVSKTLEFQFDWWYAWVSYTVKKDSVVKSGDATKTYTKVNYFVSEAPGIDSLAALNSARSGLVVPDTILQIEVKMVHIPLVDERKPASSISSSSSDFSSSSTTVSSSSAVGSSSSTTVSSSSSVNSSSSEEEDVTSIVSWEISSQKVWIRQVRRLDGSVVNNGALRPGVYYVRGENGVWKKQLVLPR